MIKRARKTDSLPLAARKADTAFPYTCVKALRQFRFDKLEYLRHSTSFPQLGGIDLLVLHTKRYVTRDGVIDKKNLLWHITNRSLPRRHAQRCKQLPIDQDLACGWI